MPAGILLPVSFSYTYMLFQSLNGIHKYVHIHTKQKEPAYAYRHEIKAFMMGAFKGLLVVLVAGVALQLAANLFASPGAAFQQTVESSFVMGMVRELLLVSGIAS